MGVKKRYMKTFGIVSYNIHCNLTKYGSALQSWALGWMIERMTRNARQRIGG